MVAVEGSETFLGRSAGADPDGAQDGMGAFARPPAPLSTSGTKTV